MHPVDNSLIGGGCVITDASIQQFRAFDRIKIDSFSKVDHCVVLPQVKIGKKLRVEKLYYRPRMRNSDGMQIGVDMEEDKIASVLAQQAKSFL